MRVIPTDVYDSNGDMLKIEFYNEAGTFEIEAVWDPEDEQTSENREKLRKWAYKMVKQLGYEVAV